MLSNTYVRARYMYTCVWLESAAMHRAIRNVRQRQVHVLCVSGFTRQLCVMQSKTHVSACHMH